MMKRSMIFKAVMLLMSFFMATSAASAANRFYIDAVNIEPGETKTLAFNLENSQEFYGFQADISLPDGVEIITVNGKPDITLSSRTDASYSIVTNLLSSGAIRFGTFSTSHTPITGNSGALLYLKVKATEEFTGGIISLTDILFIDSNDRDVQLPDFSIEIGTNHNNRFYIPDFKIAVGETKAVSIVLDNETPFTAFQTDVYLPEGLTIEANSFVLTSRASGSHSVTAKSFSDGRTRIACLSTGNSVFTGNSGELLTFNIKADKDVAETSVIELKNQIFSMANAKEYLVPNSSTTVTTERALVESVTLNKNELSLTVGDSELLSVTVLPTFASTRDVEWSSDNDAIVSVSQNGLVTANAAGTATIKVEAVDGSGKFDECHVAVRGIPVTQITLDKTSATLKETETLILTATVLPANASDKSVTWESLDPAIAGVSADGTVTAISIGNATIVARSDSDPEITAECNVTVIPMPVAEITLNQNLISLEVGSSFQLTYDIFPETATNKTVLWTSDDNGVAQVSDSGNISALSLGTAHITASAADGFGAKAICTVNVVPTPATGISITPPSSSEFKVGETIELAAVVTPENATDKSITWSSQDNSIATVNNSGIVTAVSEGDVIIQATNSADISDEITLTVVPTLAESITVIPEEVTLSVGGETVLMVTILPTTTTNKAVTWTSSAPETVNVDDQGKVTAYKVGEAFITAATNDGSQKTAQSKITVQPTPATGIKINYDGSKVLYVGDRVNLTATVTPEDATDKSVTWNSQDESVLSVTTDGVVEAKKVGQASITATNSAGQSDIIHFTVAPTLVKSITLDETSLQLKASQTYKLTATVLPEDATDKSLTWESSQPSVATVSDDGTVTAISIGNTTITVKANDASNQSVTCSVSVVPTPVESVTVTAQGSTTLKAGQTVQLDAEVLPTTATDRTVNWTSSMPDVATVSANGLVTAVSVGQTTITARSGDKSSTIVITVEKTLAESIALNRATASLKVAGTIQLTAHFTPETTTDKSVNWTSSDAGIATVSDNGLVTANAIGNCRITAVAQDGSNATAYCDITVDETAAESIKITPEGPFTLNYGDEVRLTATVLPETTTDMTVTWNSQSSAVTVDQTGLVKAVSAVENNWISATNSAGQTDYVYVTVLPLKVSKIELNQTSSQLKVNETLSLIASVFPANATDTSVTWNSTVPTVASVDAYGNVTALSIGETDIEVTANDGSGVKAVCHISVVPTPVESVTVTAQGSTTLKAGQTVQLDAEVLPTTATDRTVNWTSSMPDVATVSANGLVTAVSVGQTTITATSGDKSCTLQITVEKTLAESIVLNRSTASLKVAGTIQLTAHFTPETTTDKSVKWTSSDAGIATVSDNGLVTANGVGNCRVTVTAQDGSNATAYCDVTVGATAAESIKITPEGPFTLNYGDEVHLTATVLPETTTDMTVTWNSQSSAVTVDQTGLVKAVSAVENNWISATNSAGQTDYVYVTVKPLKVSEIGLNQTSAELKVNETLGLKATVFPANATDTSVTWNSTVPTVASVDAYGNVTALSIGETDIEVTANDGSGVKAVCHVTVVPTPVESVTVTAQGSTTLKASQTVQLDAEVLPTTATDRSVNWTSSMPDVATVSANGLVTAVSVGQTTITATSGDKSSTIVITVEKTLAESIALNRATASLKVAGTIQLTAHFTPETTTDKSVNWTSSDAGIATVSDNGLVTANAIGNCRITAVAQDGSNASAYCDITVGATAAESIKITPEGPFTLNYGDEVRLTATVLPETTTDMTVTWNSQSSAVTVDQTGLVKAVSAVENNWISATNSAGQTDYVYVTVLPLKVSKIELNQTSSQLKVNETLSLIASVFPANATDTSVTWNSTVPTVASVDDYGNVTALSIGETDIEVTANDGSGIKAVCHVSVVATPVESVKITANGSTNLKSGQTVKLSAEVLPLNATDRTVIWSSENDVIATVNDSGLVTAHAVGVTDIKATVGNKSDRISIVVEKTLIESLTFSTVSLDLGVGEEAQLTVWISPSTATNQTLQWSSQNPAIASVDNNGKVTALAIGETTVVVSATDGSGVSASLPVSVNAIPVTQIIVDYDGPTSLRVGDQAHLSARVLPENATDKTFTWKVEDPNVIVISPDGVVTAVGLGSSWAGAFSTDDYPFDVVGFTVVETPVERIEIEKETDMCHVGETIQLTAKVYPETATNTSVEWSSSDESILTVNQSGLVTAHNIGYADVTAKAMDGSNISKSVRIYVATTAVDLVEVYALGNTQLKDGETVQLTAMVYPDNATDKSVTWSSEDELVATVSEEGLVTAHSKVGETIIKATSTDGVSGEISISVIETPVESILISLDNDSLYPEDEFVLSVSVLPEKATDKSVRWILLDDGIIDKISESDSSINCIAKKPGTTIVKASSANGITGSVEIAVNSVLVEQILLQSIPSVMNVGETAQMKISILPQNATNQELVWDYDSNIISIDENFEVSALKTGSTNVVITSADGSSATASFNVTVVQPVTSIMLSEHDITLERSKTFKLEASIEPIDATDKSVAWESSNPQVADVDEYGLISTYMEGETIVSVTTLDGSYLSDECRIKVIKASQGGVEFININDVDITTGESSIVINNLAADTKVYLFGLDGILYNSAVSNGDTVKFDVIPNQYYILKIGNFSLKVTSK